MSNSLFEAFGDFVRVGIADVGETYQRVLLQHSAIAPPPGMVGHMVTTYDAEPMMSDRQLQQLIYAQPKPDERDMDI